MTRATIGKAWLVAAAVAPLAWGTPSTAQSLPDMCEQALNWGSYDNPDTGLIVPGADGWLFRTSTDLETEFELTGETQRYLTQFTDALAGRDVQLVIVVPPTRGVVHFDRLPEIPETAQYSPHVAAAHLGSYLDLMRRAGALAPNIVAAALRTDLSPEAFFLARDHHWSVAGARLSAFVVAEAIRGTPDYANLPLSDYESQPDPSRDTQIYETFAGMIEEICDVKYPDFFTPGWSTDPVGAELQAAAGGGSGLLDAAETPPIVLVGTSNSNKGGTDAFNFGGFLSEFTGLEVLNLALDGGRVDAALLSYLGNEAFLATPPDYLIWEVPPYYGLNDPVVWRQAVPAVWGPCTGPDRLSSGTATAPGEGEAVELVAPDDAVYTREEDLYVMIEADDLSMTQFEVAVERMDGTVDRYPIDRSTRVPNSGRYYLLVGEALEQPIIGITLTPARPAEGDIRTDLCRAPGA